MMSRKKIKRVVAYIATPLFFLILGYATFYVIGKPVIDFVYSTLNLMTLNEKPNFSDQSKNLYANAKPEKKAKTIKSSSIKYPFVGMQYGEISIKKYNIREPLFFGDTDKELRKGVGHFNGSVFPGEDGVTLLGGHNNTSFHRLGKVKAGDKLEVKTHYGEYTYKIVDTKIAKYNDDKAVILESKTPKILLYTCYPLDALGLTDDRLFIYADYESGPLVDPNN